jgi:5-methyltetrahydropteroyltriglutamate--homocysteine methyltransferase
MNGLLKTARTKSPTTVYWCLVSPTMTNFVEHPELIAQRADRFIAIVWADRVVAGSDCGFGTFAGFGAGDPETAFAKLKALRDGADIASRRA